MVWYGRSWGTVLLIGGLEERKGRELVMTVLVYMLLWTYSGDPTLRFACCFGNSVKIVRIVPELMLTKLLLVTITHLRNLIAAKQRLVYNTGGVNE